MAGDDALLAVLATAERLNRNEANDDEGNGMSDEWITNPKGNRVWVQGGSHVATVFSKNDGGWGAVIGGLLLAGQAKSAEDMMARVEDVLLQPDKARYVLPKGAWQRTKAGGYFKKTNGGIISVKQAKSGSWYATSQHGMLPSPEKPKWCKSAEEAMQFADSIG